MCLKLKENKITVQYFCFWSLLNLMKNTYCKIKAADLCSSIQHSHLFIVFMLHNMGKLPCKFFSIWKANFVFNNKMFIIMLKRDISVVTCWSKSMQSPHHWCPWISKNTYTYFFKKASKPLAFTITLSLVSIFHLEKVVDSYINYIIFNYTNHFSGSVELY